MGFTPRWTFVHGWLSWLERTPDKGEVDCSNQSAPTWPDPARWTSNHKRNPSVRRPRGFSSVLFVLGLIFIHFHLDILVVLDVLFVLEDDGRRRLRGRLRGRDRRARDRCPDARGI